VRIKTTFQEIQSANSDPGHGVNSIVFPEARVLIRLSTALKAPVSQCRSDPFQRLKNTLPISPFVR